jgi:hypothetical protein
VAYSQVRAVVSLVCPCARGKSQHPRVSRMFNLLWLSFGCKRGKVVASPCPGRDESSEFKVARGSS